MVVSVKSNNQSNQQFKTQCLKAYVPGKVYNSTIQRLASSYSFVFSDVYIETLADALVVRTDITAVGVVDRDGTVTGIIERNHLFTLLGRPFGREIFHRRKIADITQKVDSYPCRKNIFSVADTLRQQLNETKDTLFLLNDESNSFAGIFSSKDMLMYLSRLSTQDITLAQELQKRIINEVTKKESQSVEMLAYSQSARGVGGDFYFIKEYKPGKWIINLCDVSGKGVSASILTSLMWGIFRFFNFRKGLKTFITKLNQTIVTTFHLEKFVTGLFIDYDEKTGECLVCDMGHSMLYMYKEKKFTKARGKKRNLPVGIELQIDPQFYKLKLEPGEVLLLVTDGLLEQDNSDGGEFQEARLGRLVSYPQNKPLDEIRKDILRDFHDHRGLVPLQDDVSFIVVRRKP